MSTALPSTTRQLHSQISPDGTLTLSLEDVPLPALGADEVLIRVEAAPINPSDIGNLYGPADLATVQRGGSAERPLLTARVPERALAALVAQGPMAGRVGKAMPMGNEGAGTVVAAGASAEAQALLGRRVAALGGSMYATYRALPVNQCLLLPADASAAEGASCFVNPLTALGMVETMRREGHSALVHTAAASNLGQMLERICRKDGIGLVSIVRSPAQVALLEGQGARHVVDMGAPDFMARLTDALAATGATIAFDAVGGGPLASQILQAMEAALLRKATEYSRYGTSVHKQVYLYGGLDIGPTTIQRSVGMAWGVGGWLLWPAMAKLGPVRVAELKARVAAELRSTFASHYAGTLTLAQVLEPEQVARYAQRATGAKFLVTPQA
jgi:NADPH:quinone reductase-like Zn-dependent oxidoreductase